MSCLSTKGVKFIYHKEHIYNPFKTRCVYGTYTNLKDVSREGFVLASGVEDLGFYSCSDIPKGC